VKLAYLSNLAETHPEAVARLALLAEYQKEFASKVTIDVEGAKAATPLDKYKTLAAGGSAPDLGYVAYYEAADMFTSGMVIDVDTELKGDKEWVKQRADLYPTMLESSSWAGKLVSIPMYTNDVAVIWNKGLLDQSGVAAPKEGWTWDDLKSAAAKAAKPDRFVVSMNWGFWLLLLRTTGSSPISADAKKMTLDTPELLETIEFMQSLIKAGYAPADGKTETYREAKNDTVFEFQGPYRIPTLRQANAPAFGVIHAPVNPRKKMIATTNGGHNVVIFKETSAPRRAASAQLARWLNAPHAQAQMCIKATSLPVSKAAFASKELQDYVKTDVEMKGFIDLAPNGWRWPALPSWPKLNKAVQDIVSAILKNELSPRDGLAKAQRDAQALLDEDVKLMK
jgi:ABC-type glycerol-3-phosphate transport system substrate-binding protein